MVLPQDGGGKLVLEKRPNFFSRELTRINQGHDLFFYPHAAPEGNVVFDVFGGWFRIGVIPGGVLVFLSIHDHVVVMGGSFPGTNRRMTAWRQELALERFWREVHIAFHCLVFI